MSEPPKKRLRQSTLREGFTKQASLKECNTVSHTAKEENMSNHQDKRVKILAAAEARRVNNSPNVTPTHEPEYPEIDLDKSPKKTRKEVNGKKNNTQDCDSGPSTSKAGKITAKDQEEEDDMGDSQGSVFSKTEEEKQGFYDEESMEAFLEKESQMQSEVQKLDDTPSKGTPKSELRTTPSCAGKLNTLHPSDRHTVLFKSTTLNSSTPPKPWPKEYEDRWDVDHVKLPCSRENLYPVQGMGGKKEIKNRWEVIEEALLNDIMTTDDLEEAIKSYNARYAQKWDFSALHIFFNEILEVEERQQFFEYILPFMKKLALRMPELCTHGIPLLKKHRQHTVTFTQEQLACILANAFFCTFPRRNAHGKASEYSSYPDINFNRLFDGAGRSKFVKGGSNIKGEKLKFILNYFRRIMKKMPRGTVSFRRQVIGKFPEWDSCHDRLTKLHVSSHGNIEDDGEGMLQVDFANKFIGGGVLGYGCVQEEIRFLICPEMLASRLITEVLDKNECLIMTGAERFCNYTGYASSFKWAGDHEDFTPRDDWGRLYTEVVGIDALVFHSYHEQFHSGYIRRELNKAYCGFISPGIPEKHLSVVATGNWGCGAFGGDHRLKALIQLMSAAAAKREVCYFTFQDSKLRDELYDIHTFTTKKNLSVCDLIAMINMYERSLQRRRRPTMNLYEFIYRTYHDSDCDTDTTDEQSAGGFSPEAEYWKDNQPSPDYAANTP